MFNETNVCVQGTQKHSGTRHPRPSAEPPPVRICTAWYNTHQSPQNSYGPKIAIGTMSTPITQAVESLHVSKNPVLMIASVIIVVVCGRSCRRD